MSNYEDLLKTEYDELPVDKLVPSGTWRLKLGNFTFQRPRTPDGMPKWFGILVPLEPMDDVDTALVEQDFPDGDFSNSEIMQSFFLRKPSDITKMIEFMGRAGVVIERPFSVPKINDKLKELKGCTVLGLVGQKTRTNDQGVSESENTVSRFAADE